MPLPSSISCSWVNSLLASWNFFVVSIVCFWLSQRHGREGDRPRRKERPVPQPAKKMAVPKSRVRGRR